MSPARTTTFSETMTGQIRLAAADGATTEHPVRLELDVRACTVLNPRRTVRARATGRLHIDDRLHDMPVTGTLEIAPLSRRRIAYSLEFTADGTTHRLDGWKSISLGRPLRSMTVLPFTLTRWDAESERHDVAGTGVMRFRTARSLLPFLASFRFPRGHDGATEAAEVWRPRWRGRTGRAEVWYTTLTDPATGTGLWLHHETTAPQDGGPATAQGFLAYFPPDGPVETTPFDQEQLPPEPSPAGFATSSVEAVPGRLTGRAGPWHWDLTEQTDPTTKPLHTFPRWAWNRELLPAAHLVATPGALYHGTVSHQDGRALHLTAAPGASARIYGHGSARRWAWLHANLGDGNLLEIVAAISRRPGLDRLPPLVFLRLHRHGRTWPRRPLRPALGLLLLPGASRFRAHLARPTWTVTGRSGTRRIRVSVTLPPDRITEVHYTEPDGTRTVCRNSERADTVVETDRWWPLRGWRPESRWTLDATAHAEVGGW
ncbi:hypothetical protein ACFV0B_24505 [Streptomyces xanthophaeus]|uniref:hypothetical protein n=1 Tax=Streptomyces xanthophaeus TaxID=67385 RepID=UPI0036C8A77C